MSLEAIFVARFAAAAFWRGCGQIFVAAASCATKVRNKSLRVSQGYIDTKLKQTAFDLFDYRRHSVERILQQFCSLIFRHCAVINWFSQLHLHLTSLNYWTIYGRPM